MSRDVAPLVKAALAAGWHEVKGRKHIVLRSPDGVSQVVLPRTPSDHRSLRNSRADLRRHGLVI